jgi:prepilin-type N-terminal cleavage/methylation domain-containing protein
MKRNNGFTLVELLAVIVILSLLIVVGVPITNKVINDARKRAFVDYVDKLYIDALNQYESDKAKNPKISYQCVLYDIEKDLGLDTTKDYKGYIAIVPSIDNADMYFTIRNKKYYIKHYKYTKSEDDSSEDKKQVIDVIEKYVSNDYSDNIKNFVKGTLGCGGNTISNSVEGVEDFSR